MNEVILHVLKDPHDRRRFLLVLIVSFGWDISVVFLRNNNYKRQQESQTFPAAAAPRFIKTVDLLLNVLLWPSAVKPSSLQLFQRFQHLQSQWDCGFPDRGGLVCGSGGVSPTLFPLPCTQLSMPQPLSTSTALPAPLPCVDGQWHKVHRSPGFPPSPAADLLHSSSPSLSSSCSSCWDPPRSLLHRPKTLRRTMRQEELLTFSSQHPHHPRRSALPQRGCHEQPTSRRRCRPQWSSGVMCEAATNICRETCAGGSCSPIRNSSFASVKTETLMAPRTGMIHTVSQLISFPLLFTVSFVIKLDIKEPVIFIGARSHSGSL